VPADASVNQLKVREVFGGKRKGQQLSEVLDKVSVGNMGCELKEGEREQRAIVCVQRVKESTLCYGSRVDKVRPEVA